MELFQTVSHPFPATSLCNKPGHHLWAWAESQAREEGSDSWGSFGQVKRKCVSFWDTSGAQPGPKPQSQLCVLKPTTSVVPEATWEENQRFSVWDISALVQGQGNKRLRSWPWPFGFLSPKWKSPHKGIFLRKWETTRLPARGLRLSLTIHWSLCRLRVSKGLIIDGCDLLAGFMERTLLT